MSRQFFGYALAPSERYLHCVLVVSSRHNCPRVTMSSWRHISVWWLVISAVASIGCQRDPRGLGVGADAASATDTLDALVLEHPFCALTIDKIRSVLAEGGDKIQSPYDVMALLSPHTEHVSLVPLSQSPHRPLSSSLTPRLLFHRISVSDLDSD